MKGLNRTKTRTSTTSRGYMCINKDKRVHWSTMYNKGNNTRIWLTDRILKVGTGERMQMDACMTYHIGGR